MREEIFALVVQNALNSTKEGSPTKVEKLEAEVKRLSKFEEAIKEIYRLNLGRHLDDLHGINYVAYSDVADAYNITEEALDDETTGGERDE